MHFSRNHAVEMDSRLRLTPCSNKIVSGLVAENISIDDDDEAGGERTVFAKATNKSRFSFAHFFTSATERWVDALVEHRKVEEISMATNRIVIAAICALFGFRNAIQCN